MRLVCPICSSHCKETSGGSLTCDVRRWIRRTGNKGEPIPSFPAESVADLYLGYLRHSEGRNVDLRTCLPLPSLRAVTLRGSSVFPDPQQVRR